MLWVSVVNSELRVKQCRRGGGEPLKQNMFLFRLPHPVSGFRAFPRLDGGSLGLHLPDAEVAGLNLFGVRRHNLRGIDVLKFAPDGLKEVC